ncbi:MAG TPA: radical SAM protein [Pyrinomonadaceae bacterium]
MSVLLVNPPVVSLHPKAGSGGESFVAGQKRRLRPDQYYSLPIEHLGLMSIAAYARSQGLAVETINGTVAGHNSVEETWNEINSVAQRSGTPALIGFTNIDTFGEVEWLANRCRQEWNDVKLVIGNVFATLNYQRLLRNHSFDFVVIGEGEVSFTRLAEAVLNGTPVDQVPALAWKDEQGTIRTTPPTGVDLDQLPWPARDELPHVLEMGFAGAVYSTRGCPYLCTFCGTGATSDLLGRNRYRVRSIENMVDEIEYLKKDFGIDFISISDDLFLTKHNDMQARAKRFGDEMIRRKLGISFMFDSRVDSIVDLKLFEHLQQAGLRRVFIGLETGSYDQLISYRKHHATPGEDVAVKINALQDMGVEVIPGTIMFHPSVSPSELRETLRLLKATRYTAPRKLFDRITAYAGTPLYHEYAAKGYLTKDWPIGEWQFADQNAGRVYEQLAKHIGGNEDITFSDAEDFFLTRVAEWEAVAPNGHAQPVC